MHRQPCKHVLRPGKPLKHFIKHCCFLQYSAAFFQVKNLIVDVHSKTRVILNGSSFSKYKLTFNIIETKCLTRFPRPI